MDETWVLGIDAGGTHTDAVLLACAARPAAGDGPAATARLLGQAKVRTRHDDLPASVREVLGGLAREVPAGALGRVTRVTLGATLAVNALVQDKADAVGLALSAGPGLDPRRFALGGHACVIPGGLDHRGVEVAPLDARPLLRAAAGWQSAGVRAAACVGKFSPRNPAHELAMAQAVAGAAPGMSVTLGHGLSGRLNFPRRVATAYFNAAVGRLHNAFLDAVEQALSGFGIRAAVRLLKADGGAVPLQLSRREPVQSILSGPAASVMGALALCGGGEALRGCALLLDMGGTTTDLALLLDGSPVVDRDGMTLRGRRTLVRALATQSIGVGGDSLLTVTAEGGSPAVRVGPVREGPAMAFGGARPTLLDALNLRNAAPVAGEAADVPAGDVAASLAGLGALARAHRMEADTLARLAVEDALAQVGAAVRALVGHVNARPIYTLAALRAVRDVRPERVWLAGGPAACVARRLAAALALPVAALPHADVANAAGAALTLPTDSLELYADTGRRELFVPALGLRERIERGFRLETACERAGALLRERLAGAGAGDAEVEVTSADVFATLDDGGYGARDMRVTCQAVPGIAAVVRD